MYKVQALWLPKQCLFIYFLSLFLFLAKCFLLLTPLQSPVSDPLQGFLLLYMLSTSPPFMDGVGGYSEGSLGKLWFTYFPSCARVERTLISVVSLFSFKLIGGPQRPQSRHLVQYYSLSRTEKTTFRASVVQNLTFWQNGYFVPSWWEKIILYHWGLK